MSSAPISTDLTYWDHFQVTNDDLDFIKNYLFEVETPQSMDQILSRLIDNRIEREKSSLAIKQNEKGRVYFPKDTYNVNEVVVFSSLNWDSGVVRSIRPSNNPEHTPYKVIEVEFKSGAKRSFASELIDHPLNNPQETQPGMEYLDADLVIQERGTQLTNILESAMLADEDLVTSAALWFHRSLLVDISPGHMNLAEAILDMAGGGPLSTKALATQLDLSVDENTSLLEFSLNRALQEDKRFDEVGPSGEVLWFLEKLEPEDVRSTPLYLQHNIDQVDASAFSSQMLRAINQLDEATSSLEVTSQLDKAQTVITYPHWRAGTLPLSLRTDHLFPTAFEAPRIKFEFIDETTHAPISGWVVRHRHYVAGLRQWYLDNGVVPGSIITIHKANVSGQVLINANKRRPTKEWVRTALVGADGGVVLALLKQQISTNYDEQMTTVIPDTEALDRVWLQTGKARLNPQQSILRMAYELTKLNPQGHIHAIELFATVNVIKRIPITSVFYELIHSDAFSHVGDLYFRLNEENGQE